MATAFLLGAGAPVVQIVFDAGWNLSAPSALARKAAFFAVFELYNTEIVVDPELPPVPAVGFSNLVAWTQLGAYNLTPEANCPEGCTWTRFP